MTQSTIEIINPTGARQVQQSALAPRRWNSLSGRRVGLLDNNKPNADKFLQFVGAGLKQRDEDVELIARRKMTRTAADFLREFAKNCDVVVNAFAD